MSVRFFSSIAALAFLGVGFSNTANACPGLKTAEAKAKEVTATQLASMMKSVKGLVVLDANGQDTRTRHGVIPGSQLLSHYRDYNVARELPADKATPLVFYCSNQYCSAAPKAASKAVLAGFTNVHILRTGIQGWIAAGQAVSTPNQVERARTQPLFPNPSVALTEI